MNKFWNWIANFNPRTPCGVRPSSTGSLCTCRIFQSTHPMRGATQRHSGRQPRSSISIHAPHAGCDGTAWEVAVPERYFNPRTPCGVRRIRRSCSRPRGHFNPRTPCGVRPKTAADKYEAQQFQSTHPMRGATLQSSTLTG